MKSPFVKIFPLIGKISENARVKPNLSSSFKEAPVITNNAKLKITRTTVVAILRFVERLNQPLI